MHNLHILILHYILNAITFCVFLRREKMISLNIRGAFCSSILFIGKMNFMTAAARRSNGTT